MDLPPDSPKRRPDMRRPPARWVAPTLFFFGGLFLMAALVELITGGAYTAGFTSAPSHIAHLATEPGNFFFVVSWNLLFGTILLLTARQQWKLRRLILETTSGHGN